MSMVNVTYRAGSFVTTVKAEVRMISGDRVLLTQAGMSSVLRLADVVSVDGVLVGEYFAGKVSGNGLDKR